MTAPHRHTESTSRPTGSTAAPTAEPGILRCVWRAVLDVMHGIDAGSLVAHGRQVPPDHPARRRRFDHEEVERRLAELYPRS